MFTEDYIREAVVDNVLPATSTDSTFADLGISPQRIDLGLPIEHVRYYRVGGECDCMLCFCLGASWNGIAVWRTIAVA